MILTNAQDDTVGAMVRDRYRKNWQAAVDVAAGSPERGALFSAAMFGLSVAEKTLDLEGLSIRHGDLYERQIRALFEAALSFDG